jgi:hypothetical protein
MSESKRRASSDGGAKDRPWELRLWAGMTMQAWFGLLKRNRFHVSLSRIPMVIMNSGISGFNSILALLQRLFYGRRIEQCELAEDPIFIIGHWRTGTTWLHELMVLDDRYAYPTSYDCFAPRHFLFSERLTRWWLWLFLPRRRPMDNITVGLDSPQEDEHALYAMGMHSPYLTWAFPNHPPQDQEYLDLRTLQPQQRKSWKEALHWFLRALQVKYPGKRLVLKSPTHTFRVPVLLEMFPRARFVYMVRDPLVIFPSMLKTWKRLYRYHGAQVPKYEGLEEYVFETFNRMLDVFEEDRRQIDDSRLCTVRYEDLVADPLTQLQRIYDELDLGEFEQVKPRFEERIGALADYRVNRHELPPALHDQIVERWAPYFEKYGYSKARNDNSEREPAARESS